tara:strand:- start:192 stop:431 length:240 start_codon:yes stop_codon:yes gene_type:complete
MLVALVLVLAKIELVEAEVVLVRLVLMLRAALLPVMAVMEYQILIELALVFFTEAVAAAVVTLAELLALEEMVVEAMAV